MTGGAAPRPRPTYATDRLGALSDGVFAIVLTLLVLDLKVPELPAGFTEQQMLTDLEGQIPNFVAWLVSFVLLARFWMVHHAVVALLARCHTGTMVWNFIVLGLVSLVPFGAALIGTYEYDPAAVTVFAALLGTIGLAMGLFARHALTETTLHRAQPSAGTRRLWTYHSRVLPAFAVASIVLVNVAPALALAIWVAEPAVALLGSAHRHS